MIYIKSEFTDPSWNLAMEEYLVDLIPPGERCLYLWQNDNTIVVGKNQNTLAEINLDYVQAHRIHVCRRLSGGGAVYHDLGNLNYTWIADAPRDGGIAFAPFCTPVVEAIRSYGVEAELSGRNDILVEGKKISGNAQYYHHGKVIHHGTILFSSQLNVLSEALKVDQAKFQGKGISSVRSRVTNLHACVGENVTLEDFCQRLIDCIRREDSLTLLELTQRDREEIGKLQQRYNSWLWNYGYSPALSRTEKIRIDGCGTLELFCRIERGVLESIRIRGDFFGQKDISGLENALEGCGAGRSAIRRRLETLRVEDYISGLDAVTLASLIAPEDTE